jgi:hypothetical protein
VVEELEAVIIKRQAVMAQTQPLIIIQQSAAVEEQVMVLMLKLEVQVEVVVV